MTDGADTVAETNHAARRDQRVKERRQTRRHPVGWIVFGAALAVILTLVAAEVALTTDRIHPGVSVAGVSVGGMKPDSARAVLETSLPARIEAPVVVRYGEKTWQVKAEDIGLGFAYDDMIASAMRVGRTGGVWRYFTERMGAWISGVDLDAVPTAEPVRSQTVLARISSTIDVAAVDASVRVSGTSVAAVPGTDGAALDHTRAREAILAAMVGEKRTVDAPIRVVPMDVTLAEAEATARMAERMLSGTATVTHADGSWTFQPTLLAKLVAFRRSDAPPESFAATVSDEETLTPDALASREVTLVAYVSPKAVAKHVVPVVGAKLGTPAIDAEFKTSAGRVTIIPSKDGVGPDVDGLATDLTEALAQAGGGRSVELRTIRAQPEITTEKARAMGVAERIARFTTTYSASNRPRVNNIHLLGDALDGTLIAPGDTFSFNGTIGPRTAAKGYQEAGAIVNGRLVPQLGGGICQVGTTLYNAVYESGLPIVERRNHSFYIDIYPKGRDATVSWGGPDIRFKNDTEHWVLISVSYSSTSVTIALYGTDPGYDVESRVGSWTGIKPFPIEEIKDPTMYVGAKTIEESGVTGRSITVWRTVYRDGEVLREETFVSRYRPKTQVVRVGTKPKVKGSSPTTTSPVP